MRFRRRRIAARRERVRIDVPGVERDRVVVVKLEPIPRRGERLAPGVLVEDARHRALLGELDAQVPILGPGLPAGEVHFANYLIDNPNPVALRVKLAVAASASGPVTMVPDP